MRDQFGKLAKVWLALVALLMLSLGSAYLPMGAWNGVANLGIALLKAALVAVYFMHLAASRTQVRLAAAAAVLVFLLLQALTGADYLSRTMHRAPWSAPPAAGTSTNLAPAPRSDQSSTSGSGP